MPLHQRAVVLLFLVDRGVVERTVRRGRRVFEPLPHAESWVESQPSLQPYCKPTLELLAALRHELHQASSFPPGLSGRVDRDRLAQSASVHALLEPDSSAGERAAGRLDVGAAGIAPDDRLAEVAQQRVAEPPVFFGAGGDQSAGRVGHVDQVEPHGRVADQVGERQGVGLVDIDPADADIGQHDSVAPGQRVPARGRHDLGDRRPGGERNEPGTLRVGRRPQADRQAKRAGARR